MTMTERRPAPVVPLEEAIAQLDSPEAVADRRKRGLARAKALEGDAPGRVIWNAGTVELDRALAPLRRQQFPSTAEVREAEIEAGHGVDQLVAKQCEIHSALEDMQAIYADPDRMESDRVWHAYCVQVTAAAFQWGNKSEDWVRRWRQLVADRAAAEEYGDPTGAIDARLERHVGIPYPRLPEAAWAAVDTIPGAAEREAELLRLERKYPGTRPGTSPTTDAPPKRRGRR